MKDPAPASGFLLTMELAISCENSWRGNPKVNMDKSDAILQQYGYLILVDIGLDYQQIPQDAILFAFSLAFLAASIWLFCSPMGNLFPSRASLGVNPPREWCGL